MTKETTVFIIGCEDASTAAAKMPSARMQLRYDLASGLQRYPIRISLDGPAGDRETDEVAISPLLNTPGFETYRITLMIGVSISRWRKQMRGNS